jgi:hypothetical protein
MQAAELGFVKRALAATGIALNILRYTTGGWVGWAEVVGGWVGR